MKIWAISDTHMRHWELEVPDVDMVIHAGDATNVQNPGMNQGEYTDFMEWWRGLEIKHKVLIAGNHDTSIETRNFNVRHYAETFGFHYLEHEHVVIEGIKIFGSPYTPTFGQGWAFNKDRDKLDRYWSTIDSDTDIVVTHGPPRGVLDATDGRYTDPRWNEKYYKLCGCTSLLNHMRRVQPKYHIFGHIHTEEMCPNSGTRTINGLDTVFVNASVVDLRRYEIVNNGLILEI